MLCPCNPASCVCKTKNNLATVHPARRFTRWKFWFTIQGLSNDILAHLQAFHILSHLFTLTAPGLPSRFLNSASCFRCWTSPPNNLEILPLHQGTLIPLHSRSWWQNRPRLTSAHTSSPKKSTKCIKVLGCFLANGFSSFLKALCTASAPVRAWELQAWKASPQGFAKAGKTLKTCECD